MKKHILYWIVTLIIIVSVSFFTWLNVNRLQEEWYKKDSYVICETPYVWATYRWNVKESYKNYIYLDWEVDVVFDCIYPREDKKLEEWEHYCWDYIRYQWPVDTEWMICYVDWDIKSYMKERAEFDEKEKEEGRNMAELNEFRKCKIYITDIVDRYNSILTMWWTYTDLENKLKQYFTEKCPKLKVS